MKTAIRAKVTHDLETWDARLGQPLTGRDRDGRHLSSKAVVLGIEPEASMLLTNGAGGDWHTNAQVHKIEDVEWVDLETEDVPAADVEAVKAARADEGWAVYQALDVGDGAQVRIFFTRPLA